MPDISMCANAGCPLRPKCYRAQATPDPHWQSYMVFDHTDLDDKGVPKCLWVMGRK